MSQNSELGQACEAWMRSVALALKLIPISLKDDREITFFDNGHSSEPIKTPDLSLYIFTNQPELFNLSEFKKIVEIIFKTPILLSVLCVEPSGNIPSEPRQQRYNLERYFHRFLLEYLKTNPDPPFSSEAFDRLYEKLEEFIYGTQPIVGVWSVHIRNLKSELDNIKIKGGVYLRQATHEEKADAVKLAEANWQHIPFKFLDVPEMFLDIYQQIDGATAQKPALTPQEVMSLAERLLLALRLLKPYPIGIASYRWDTPEQPFTLYKGKINSIMLRPSEYRGEPYQLTEGDTDELLKLWRSIKQALSEPELAIALSRFEDSYTRTKLEDKLIDYWIALEALFFALIDKEYVGNMGETVASTISYFLGKTADERRSIYTAIISSHKARGHFVHGQRGKLVENLDLVVKKTEKYLRMALCKRIMEFEN